MVLIENSIPSGFFIDLIGYFADRKHWDVHYVEAPWSELLVMLEKGEIDLLPAVSYTVERSAIYDFSRHPVYIDSGVLFTSPKFTVHTIFDLRNKRIAGVRGSIFTDKFIEYVSSFGIDCEILYCTDNQAVMKEISLGNVEAGVCIYSLGTILAKEYRVIVTPISFSPLALEFAVPKGKNADILEGIDRLMTPMINDPSSFYSKSFAKWTFPSQAFQFSVWLKLMFLILLFLGLFLILWTVLLRQMVRVKTKSLKSEIIERKQAELKISQSLLEKETLIRELYHRTKNTIQVIRGMLVLQADTYPENEQIKDLVRHTEVRIQTISLVHQMLYMSQDLSQISMKSFLYELTSLIMRDFSEEADSITLEMDIVDRLTLLDTAIPLGLIITELMTNSLKYAFSGKQSGIIRISLRVNDNHSFVLSYSDNGIGISKGYEIKNSPTFGFKLINDIVEMQLQGKVSYQNDVGFGCIAEFSSDLYRERV